MKNFSICNSWLSIYKDTYCGWFRIFKPFRIHITWKHKMFYKYPNKFRTIGNYVIIKK